MTMPVLPYDRYLDRVLGCWIGKSLGGLIGAPYESHKIFGHVTPETCWPSTLFPNDDLDIQVVWLEMLEEVGPAFRSEDLVRFWQDRCWYNFAEYGAFLYNAQRGIAPPLSGRFNNVFYSESQGCPIRAEIWGTVCPGNPALAARFARMDGELDHVEDSVWAEQYWAACVALAFVTPSLEEVLDRGLAFIPTDCDIARIAAEVPALFAHYGRDLERTWLGLVRRYGHRDVTRVHINFALTLLCLYSGGGDFRQTIVDALNLGYDADCTAATAGALLGTLQGARQLPAEWVERMGPDLTCDVAVRHKTASLETFARDTCRVGIETTLALGSEVEWIGVPEIELDLARQRQSERKAPPIRMAVDYAPAPVLYRDRSTRVRIRLSYCGPLETERFSFAIRYPDGVEGSLERGEVVLVRDTEMALDLSIRTSKDAGLVRDRNPVRVDLVGDSTGPSSLGFGLAGARQWTIYGPYWDAWDRDRFGDECPYRNDRLVSHPIHIDGCQYIQEHHYVDPDRPYLDEARLLQGEVLQEEHPYLVESGEDHLADGEYGGFAGEACYYFVRTLTSAEPQACTLSLGCSGLFRLFLNGQEVLRQDSIQGWATHNFRVPVTIGHEPLRVVLKAVRPADHMTVSLCFLKLDIPGDRTRGISYLLDSTADLVDRSIQPEPSLAGVAVHGD